MSLAKTVLTRRATAQLHEAMMHVDDTELPPGQVVSELRPGYTLNGRLLRAARVSVSAMPDAPVPPPAAQAPAEESPLEDE